MRTGLGSWSACLVFLDGTLGRSRSWEGVAGGSHRVGFGAAITVVNFVDLIRDG